jgi:hypothetical protein
LAIVLSVLLRFTDSDDATYFIITVATMFAFAQGYGKMKGGMMPMEMMGGKGGMMGGKGGMMEMMLMEMMGKGKMMEMMPKDIDKMICI